MSTNGSEERNRCAIRELKPGRAMPQQIQNYTQSPRKNGGKLVSNKVFKQIPGSMKRDTSPTGKAVDKIGPLFGSPHSSCSTSARQVRCEFWSTYLTSPADGKQLLEKVYHFPPGFRPISFSTSLTMLRSTNWSRSGSGFPCGQPSSGVVRDSKRSLISSGGISGLYLS